MITKAIIFLFGFCAGWLAFQHGLEDVIQEHRMAKQAAHSITWEF